MAVSGRAFTRTGNRFKLETMIFAVSRTDVSPSKSENTTSYVPESSYVVVHSTLPLAETFNPSGPSYFANDNALKSKSDPMRENVRIEFSRIVVSGRP